MGPRSEVEAVPFGTCSWRWLSGKPAARRGSAQPRVCVRVDRAAVSAGFGRDPVAVELQQVVGGRHQAPLG